MKLTTGKFYEPSSVLPQKGIQFYGSKGRKLGEGAYGAVYLTNKNNKQFAIKRIRSQDDGVAGSTLQEISVMIRSDHPNLLPLIDAFTQADKTFLVTPVADYGDLKSNLIYGRLTDVNKKRIAYQILLGVGYLHSRDIIHRDLKPQNILVFSDKSIKIADFGLARTSGCLYATGFTSEVYTLWYRPLEILLGEKDHLSSYNIPADVWSVGCVLYELYTHQPLFPGDTEIDQIFRIFRVLGTPTEESWSGVTKFSNWRGNFPKWKPDLKSLRQSLGRSADPGLVELVVSILQETPDDRPTIFQLIRDSYWDDLRVEEDEPLPLVCGIVIDYRESYPVDTFSVAEEKIRTTTLMELLDIYRSFKLRTRTWFMALWLFDATVSTIAEADALLFGISCLNIAAKYCELYAPEINDYIYDTNYSKPQILEMEKAILGTVNLDLIQSSAYDYLVEDHNTHPDRPSALALLFLVMMTKLRYQLPNALSSLVVLMAEIANHREVQPTNQQRKVIREFINQLPGNELMPLRRLISGKHQIDYLKLIEEIGSNLK